VLTVSVPEMSANWCRSGDGDRDAARVEHLPCWKSSDWAGALSGDEHPRPGEKGDEVQATQAEISVLRQAATLSEWGKEHAGEVASARRAA
jgi:hypothetical protein